MKDSKPRGRPLSTPTPDNVLPVRDAMLRSPRRSALREALALRLNECNVSRIVHKDMHYHPYKIQVAQELSELDKVGRLQFCNEFLDLVKSKSDIVNTLLMSDEAHCHVSGYVNKQNCRYWATNNPHELHQRPLHSVKVTVWNAVSSHGIIGPNFFENEEGRTVSVNAGGYKVMLETFLHCVTSSPARFVVVPTRWSNCTQQKFPCKFSGQCFRADSFLVAGTIPDPPAHLTSQYQTTSSGTTLKARYTKHVLPILTT